MRAFLLLAAAAALAACSQPAPSDDEGAANDVVQAEAVSCQTVPALSDDLGMETHGAVAGQTITATPGAVACSEPALDSVECEIAGPADVRVASSEDAFVNYVVSAGQSGVLTVGPEGSACQLNAGEG